MENEEFLNNLKQVNTLIDVQLSRLDSVERNNPKQVVYLQQIHNALIKPEESCDSCFVLPSTSTGTGGGGGGSPFSCDGAIDRIMVGAITDGGLIDVYVDDVLVVAESGFMFRLDGIAPALADFDIDVKPYDALGNEITVENVPGSYYSVDRVLFKNLSDVYKRIRIETIDANSVATNYTPENAAFDYDWDTVSTTFCLAPIDTNSSSSRYTLTVDDKGIFPSDNIYSGTISPPNPSLYLSFRIQWYSDMNLNAETRNSRVFYVDNDNMQFSPDGSTWAVNLNTLQSLLLPNHMDESGFYELAIVPIAGINDPSSEIISDQIYYPYTPN